MKYSLVKFNNSNNSGLIDMKQIQVFQDWQYRLQYQYPHATAYANCKQRLMQYHDSCERDIISRSW